MVQFGLSLKPMGPAGNVVRMAQLAEANGFSYVWVGESPMLWQDVYTVLALVANHTERIRFGPFVTNPVIRDVTVTASALSTLNEISSGRVDCGLGSGDSALRMLGKRPSRVADIEHAVELLRSLCGGGTAIHNGVEAHLAWSKGPTPPIWVAGLGPRVLQMAGRCADGVILSPADPEVIEWCLGFVREGAREARRSFEDIRVICTAAVCITADVPAGRNKVRWFPAVVSNHVIDLVDHRGAEDLPVAVTKYWAHREAYDWQRHGRKDASHNEFISDEVVDSAAIVGSPDAVRTRIRDLEAVGVHQVVAQSADWADAEALITAIGADLTPAS